MVLDNSFTSSLRWDMNKAMSNLSDSTARLNSVYRINSAADDAAGFNISEKLRSIDRGCATLTIGYHILIPWIKRRNGGA